MISTINWGKAVQEANIHAFELKCECSRLHRTQLRLPVNDRWLLVSLEGNATLLTSNGDADYIAEGNIGIGWGQGCPLLGLSQGTHHWLCYQWSEDIHSIITSAWQDHTESYFNTVGVDDSVPCLKNRSEILQLKHESRQSELNLLSSLGVVLSEHRFAPRGHLMARIPNGIPQTLDDLLREIKEVPARDWTLKSAAEYSGYSQYHLSRMVRKVMNYGFREFVDRCRMEKTLEALMKVRNNPEAVYDELGYGSLRSMKHAVVQTIGFSLKDIDRNQLDKVCASIKD